MGYQETFLRVKNTKFFDAIVSAINSTGKQYYEDNGFSPVAIMTFLKDHKPFKKGEKAIYFVGDRGCQRCPGDLIGSEYSDLISDDMDGLLPDDNICEAIFTEEVNPKGIFEDSGKVTDVTVEEFKFSETQPFPDADTCLLHYAPTYEETPEDELKFVSNKIKKSALYKNYEKFRDYLASKGFKIFQGPRESFMFKAYHDSKFDKEELLQKLKEFGFVLNYVSYSESVENRNFFSFNESNHVTWSDVDDYIYDLLKDDDENETHPVDYFIDEIKNAYKHKPKLSEDEQEHLDKSNALIKYLLKSDSDVFYIDLTDCVEIEIKAKITKQINFEELKNEVIKSGLVLIENTSWENDDNFLPGIQLNFYGSSDDDDYFDDYEENVVKELKTAELNLNKYLKNPSIQSTIKDCEDRDRKSGNPTPESIFQMNDLCRDLLALDCFFIDVGSPAFYYDDGYYNYIVIEPSEKFDFNKFKEILEKTSFYVKSVENGRITLHCNWDVSECNLYWY